MPRTQVPDRFAPLLARATPGHLATISHHGSPEVNPVWFLWEDGHLLLSVKADTRKYANLRRNPSLALSIVDPGNMHHYIELRGVVVDFELYRTLEFVNRLAQKYTGQDMDPARAGEERYKLTVGIRSWTGQ